MSSTSTASSRALLIEDDLSVREAVSIAFEGLGFVVRAQPTGEHLAAVMDEFRPDVAIIDIQLPAGPNGFQLARQVISLAGVPVVFLTAADGLDDRLAGFEAGGDDYIVKPFAMSELLARRGNP
jgi:two-component system OmpR family response regulator